MTGRNITKKYRSVINFIALCLSILPKFVRIFIFESCRNLRGKFGILLRYLLIKHLAKSCGDNVCIKENVFLYHIQNISLGNNVSIHPLCYIDAIGEINIGNNVSIAHNCSILSFNHTYQDLNTPIKYNSLIMGKITIGSDIWVGCGSRILADVEIENRCIIAAGAVVNKSIPPYSIVAGVPAKVIKTLPYNY